MAQAITDSLVPFTWFLVPVFIAALALALLILFAFQTSRAAKWFLYWLDARGIRRPEGRFRALLVRRARGRSELPARPAGEAQAEGEASARGFLKSRARQRLQEKTGVAPVKSVAERLELLSAAPREVPLSPSVSEDVLRRLEASGRGLPGGPAPGAPRGSQALQASRQMTDSMLRSLEEQVRQGLLTPQAFEEMKTRLLPKT
ncbi:MAG: hypothetical protein QXO51_05535 [Halobacteria archaeon]